MDAQTKQQAASTTEFPRWTPFRDLRAHNERRANLARFLDARRRKQIERVIQVGRQRRFRQQG